MTYIMIPILFSVPQKGGLFLKPQIMASLIPFSKTLNVCWDHDEVAHLYQWLGTAKEVPRKIDDDVVDAMRYAWMAVREQAISRYRRMDMTNPIVPTY